MAKVSTQRPSSVHHLSHVWHLFRQQHGLFQVVGQPVNVLGQFSVLSSLLSASASLSLCLRLGFFTRTQMLALFHNSVFDWDSSRLHQWLFHHGLTRFRHIWLGLMTRQGGRPGSQRLTTTGWRRQYALQLFGTFLKRKMVGRCRVVFDRINFQPAGSQHKHFLFSTPSLSLHWSLPDTSCQTAFLLICLLTRYTEDFVELLDKVFVEHGWRGGLWLSLWLWHDDYSRW